MTRRIVTIIIMNLSGAATAAAENEDVAVDVTDPAALGMTLVETANTAAIEEAIEAVLAENKLDLDSRFTGRTSLTIVDRRKASRDLRRSP